MTTKQAMPYMKYYLSYLTDDDFTELDRVTRSFYWDFYLLAWNADAEGNIQSRETGEALSPERIAKRLYEVDIDKVNTALAKLREAGFIELLEETNTWRVTRYADEQEKQEEKRKLWKIAKAAQRAEAEKNKPKGDKPSGEGDKGTKRSPVSALGQGDEIRGEELCVCGIFSGVAESGQAGRPG